MLKIEVSQPSDRTELYRQTPLEEHAQKLVAENCELWRDGKKWFTYIHNFPMEDFREAILSLDKMHTSRRQSGVASRSRTFGYMPRMPVQQRDYCFNCSLNREYPAIKSVLYEYSNIFARILENHYPERYEISKRVVSQVKPEWIMPGGVFTSGIINQDNPLQYHYDAGNFEDTWSVMAVFKNQIAGGHLILPEHNIKFSCSDSSIVIFDGQSELHGVSPISKMTADSYRYSIVFYAIEAMMKCGTPKEELRRAQISRTKVEMKRAGR